jgi:hypothetical protein
MTSFSLRHVRKRTPQRARQLHREVACGGGKSREIALGLTERDRLEDLAIDYGESRRVHQHLTSTGLLPFVVQDICRAQGK